MGNKERKRNETAKKEASIVTKESICSTCALFSFLALLILCTRTLIFGSVGETIHIFLTGLFGYLSYPVFLGALYLSIMGLLGKRLVKNRKVGVCVGLTLAFSSLIAHTAFTYSWNLEGYLKQCFLSGESFPNTAPCGLLGGLVVFGVATLITPIGGLVLFSSMTLFTAYLCYVTAKGGVKPVKEKKSQEVEARQERQPQTQALPEEGTAYVETTRTPNPMPYGGYNGQADYAPVVTQRPEVSLQDGTSKGGYVNVNDGQGFSPFSMPESPAQPAPQTPYDSRGYLFGSSPAENYSKNLLFDPNAQVNRRPPVEPPSATVESSYTPSYTDSYSSAVNEAGAQTPPAKIVTDRTYASYEESTSFGRSVPTTPSVETPFVREERAPVFEEPTPPIFDRGREETVEPVVERDTGRDFGRDAFKLEDEPLRGEDRTPVVDAPEEGYRRHDYMDLFSPSNPNVFGNDEAEARRGREFADRAVERGSSMDEIDERGGRDGLNLLDEEDDPYTLRSDFEETREIRESRSRGADVFDRSSREEPIETRGREFIEERTTPVEPPKPVEQRKPEPPKPRVIRPYVRPHLDDFDCRDITPTANAEEVQLTKENIIATLEEFKITGASIASVTFGPTVTRYNVTIPRSISPKKVVALDQSIAINLHSSGVNIYPNYEDGVVSIEVPNKDRQFVQLGCMLSGDSFVNAKSSSLVYAMGKDVANRKVYGDISKMIHMLVAGSSGSGKSVFLGSLIVSLIYKYSPEELRLILIDPKQTEFVLYNNLPHLMINEIITDPGKAVQSLNWAIGEMNRRYSLFEKMSRAGTYVVNLDQYNEQLDKAERLPKIVIIIDELADLMLAAKKEMEDRIQNLTQKARAAGIHLIVATQRPSTDVITGVIKSNLATRVAFYVATDVDSRVILDKTGAQNLLGKGDFLYTMPGINVPVRVQSAFISPEESQRVVNFIKNNNEAYYDEEATAYINSTGGNGGSVNSDNGNGGEVDPMYIDALRYVIQSKSASISMIQRKCSAGYNRAGKIVEWMEDMGYISPFDGAKARTVLITKEEFESKYGPL